MPESWVNYTIKLLKLDSYRITFPFRDCYKVVKIGFVVGILSLRKFYWDLLK